MWARSCIYRFVPANRDLAGVLRGLAHPHGTRAGGAATVHGGVPAQRPHTQTRSCYIRTHTHAHSICAQAHSVSAEGSIFHSAELVFHSASGTAVLGVYLRVSGKQKAQNTRTIHHTPDLFCYRAVFRAATASRLSYGCTVCAGQLCVCAGQLCVRTSLAWQSSRCPCTVPTARHARI